MKKFLIIISIGFLGITFTGCEKQVLNKEPTSFFVEDDIWADIELAKKYVFRTFIYMGNWDMDGVNWDVGGEVLGLMDLCDEGLMNWDRGTYLFNYGNINASELGQLANRWSWNYKGIRDCNIFFENIDKIQGDPEEVKRLEAEIRFVRAHLYANLVNYHGGVPIVTNVFQLDDEFTIARSSYKECIDFIVDELDNAAEILPKTVSSSELGRITKGACLALKSELLLYAASKLHDPDTQPNGPLYDYDVPTKWQDASDAAKAVLDLNQYSLYPVDEWEDYTKIFLSNNNEIIFARHYLAEYAQQGIDKTNTPNGYDGYTGNLPLGNMADEFEMSNGKMINDPESGYDPSPEGIYLNRDPRFYADIIYNGCQFRGRDVQFYLPGGLDSPDGPSNWNYAETGYAIRKFMDENHNYQQINGGTQPFIFWRLAEIYLNYAEAEYHLTHEDVARDYVNAVRSRVGIPDVNSTGEQLLEDIQHERRIELCFENKRFFDVRRWMIADETDNAPAMGIEWNKLDSQGNLLYTGTLNYNIITLQQRIFIDRMYYLPIPLDEIERSDLEQNVGY